MSSGRRQGVGVGEGGGRLPCASSTSGWQGAEGCCCCTLPCPVPSARCTLPCLLHPALCQLLHASLTCTDHLQGAAAEPALQCGDQTPHAGGACFVVLLRTTKSEMSWLMCGACDD